MAQVASNQYGGQSFTLAHLAPFVDISRKKLRKNVVKERKAIGESMDDEIIDKIKRCVFMMRSNREFRRSSIS